MVGSKKTLPTLQGMVLSLNVTNKTVRDNYLIRRSKCLSKKSQLEKHAFVSRSKYQSLKVSID